MLKLSNTISNKIRDKTHIIISHFIDVGKFAEENFIDIFKKVGKIIIPKPEAGRFLILGASEEEDLSKTYVREINKIFSPRIIVAKRFLTCMFSKESFKVKSITFKNEEVNVIESDILVNLFSNGIVEFSIHLFLEADTKLVYEVLSSPSKLLFETDLKIDADKEIEKYIQKIAIFERNAGREPKNTIWNIFMAFSCLILEKYLHKIPNSFSDIASMLRSPAMDDYFVFIYPNKYKSLIKLKAEKGLPYFVVGDTMHIFSDNITSETFKSFLRLILTFNMVTYIVSSIKFIIGTLLKPLKYYKDMDDFVKLTDLVSRFGSDINSMAFIKLVPENEYLLEFVKYITEKMYVKNLLEDMNFSMKLLERKLDIISTKANEEALRIFNTLLSGSLAIDLASIIKDYYGYGLLEFSLMVVSWWIILFLFFWLLQQRLERRFFAKTLRSTIG